MTTEKRTDDFPVGLRFGDRGRYELRERIGRGGMADVFKVVDTHLNNRLYAVKILSSTTLSHKNPELLRQLFIEEATALSRIRDNNVVQIVSNGLLEDEHETPYMVMEYLDGRDLSALLKVEKQLPIERAVDIILAVCAGINACHLARVIHRDLKPANIFLDHTLKGEEPKVLDFSVAKIPLSAEQTKTDFVVGTESYMAPEVVNGKPANERSDQYSIGALLYQCLTGQVPRGFLSNPRELRPEIPTELEATLLRAMDPKPDRRFSTVHELGRSLLPYASPLGRAKWNHYYTTPPLPVRAAFSEPLLSDPTAPPTSTIGVTRVSEYDFVAHEHTTQTHQGEPSTSSTTIPGGVRPRADAKAPVAVEPVSHGSSAVSASPGARRRVMVGLGIVVALVAAGATGAILLSNRPRETPPVPPAWTRATPTPIAPTPTPSPTPAMPPPRPPTVLHAEPITAPASEPEVRKSAPPQEVGVQSVRTKKKRQRRADDGVRYTREGNPIFQ